MRAFDGNFGGLAKSVDVLRCLSSKLSTDLPGGIDVI